MIAESSSRQLELDFSNDTVQHRDSNFEFYQQVSRDIRALLKENKELKSQLAATSSAPTSSIPEQPLLPSCVHPRMQPGLDRAHCPDCNREFKPWLKEYKSSLECAVVSRPPGDSATNVQGDKGPSARRPPGQLPEIASERKHTTASGWVEKYVTRRRWEYHRYCWQEGRKGKIHRMHIPNDSGKLAAVRSAIAQGQTPQEIEQVIKSWSSRRG